MSYAASFAARRPDRPLRLFALGCALLTALSAVAGCQNNPVPAAEFVNQAERFHREALASTINPSNRDLNEYISEVGRRVIEGASEATEGRFSDPVFANMQFHLVGSDVPNACTTGGRHVYIYNGLFQLCRSEEELAAVMAHEFAHAVDLDVQRTGMRPPANNTLDQIAFAFAQFPFSPGVERAADARAFRFYARAGWDPEKFGNVFESLRQAGLEAGGAGRGVPNVPGVPLSARGAAADALASELPAAARKWRRATVADARTFLQLRDQAKSRPADGRFSSQNRSWLYLEAMPNCLLPGDLPVQKRAQEQLRRDTTPVITRPGPEPS